MSRHRVDTFGTIWVKVEPSDQDKEKLGTTISVVVTDPGDSERVLFKAGPYRLAEGQSISHEKLTGRFDF